MAVVSRAAGSGILTSGISACPIIYKWTSEMNSETMQPAEHKSPSKTDEKGGDLGATQLPAELEKAPDDQTSASNISQLGKKAGKSEELTEEKSSPETLPEKSQENKGIMEFLRLKIQEKEIDVRWSRDYSIYTDDGVQAPLFQPRKTSFLEYLKINQKSHTNFDQALDPGISRESKPLEEALLKAGVDSVTAKNARRTINAFMDTPAYYKNAAEAQDDYLKAKLRETLANTEECQGITSYYLSGRAFYGLAQFEDIDFVDTLKIYDEIEYEAPTPLFAESDEETTEESESSLSDEIIEEEEHEQLVGLSEQELYYKLSGKTRLEADDLGQEDGFEQKGRSIAELRLLHEFLCKRQDYFDYPVQQICPEGLRGEKSLMYCFDGSGLNVEREDIQIATVELPNRLKPLFINVGEHGNDLLHCFKDQDYIVEYERDEIDE